MSFDKLFYKIESSPIIGKSEVRGRGCKYFIGDPDLDKPPSVHGGVHRSREVVAIETHLSVVDVELSVVACS